MNSESEWNVTLGHVFGIVGQDACRQWKDIRVDDTRYDNVM
jgi:hypothetical protein